VPDPRPRRRASLTELLRAANLDALLLTGPANIQYITGFTGSNALVLVTPHETFLITDFRYATQVRDEVEEAVVVAIEPQSLWAALWRILPERHVGRVGFESGQLLHRDFERLLQGGSQWEWRPTLDLVESLRERKDAEEIASIARAADVATHALEATVSRVRAGMTELEIAGLLEQALRSYGSQGFPFETIVASGPRAALPHARAGTRRVEKGEFLLVDFGAIVDGYCADITRTFVVGRASEEQRRVYDIVRAANEQAAERVRPGMKGRDADAVARSYIEDLGFGEAFGHGLGHGIGLEVHEAPRLARTSETELPEGAVVTIEPGIYRAGWGGVRIEDDVVLQRSGPRVLTNFPRELMEIG